MAIYSTSRISGMRNSAGADVVANESYVGTAGLSRALYESMVNDRAIFEAAIGNDFTQLNGLHEGTLLESELQALDEANAQSFIETIKAALKKFWEKIKGVFKTVYAKLTQYIVGHGKSYVALHKKEIETKDFRNFTLKKYRAKKSGMDAKDLASFRISSKHVSILKKATDKDAYRDGSWVNNMLSNKLGESDVTAANFKKKAIEKYFETEKEYKGSELNGMFRVMMDNISTGSKPIKELKEAEKKAGEEIHNAIKEIDAIGKKLKGEKEDNATVDGYSKDGIEVARAYSAAVQKLVSIGTGGAIAVIRYGISQDRAAIARAVAYNPSAPVKENALITEAAEEEAEYEVEELYDDSVAEVPEEFAPELADAVVDVPADED